MVPMIEGMDFYLLRTPRLPLATLDVLDELTTPESIDAFLRALFSEPEMLDAICLASDELGRHLAGWLEYPKEPLSSRVRLSLYKYVLRMSGRATPFGKFSGIGLGEYSAHSEIILSGHNRHSVRFDMGFSGHVTKALMSSSTIRHSLQYSVNNSLYVLGDHYRFVERVEVDGNRSYKWTKVSRNPILHAVFEAASTPVSFCELVVHVSGLGVPVDSAVEYLDLLIKEQLLVSELEPSITGGNHFMCLCDKVTLLAPSEEMAAHLGQLEEYARQATAGQIPASVLKSDLGPLEEGWNGRDVVQVDMRLGTDVNRLGQGVRNTVLREISELIPLNSASAPKQLSVFRHRFESRYGDLELPLMEVLDQDRGIGYGDREGQYLDSHPLIKGLGFSADQRKESMQNQISSSLFADFWRTDGHSMKELEVYLPDVLLAKFSGSNTAELPVTGFVFGEILAKNIVALDSGDFRFNMMACSGPSALPLMARFSHLDADLESKLRECAAMEDARCGQAVIAEIVHLPEDRIGNIMQRPRLRKYEIPFLGNSSVSSQYQIPLTDLYVSVKDGKVWLRSESLDRYVIPRLSCAHNFRYGVTAYQFLCDLQFQSNSLDVSWNWGHLDRLPFLPRVSYKHLILSRARWQISKEAIDDLLGKDDSEFVTRLADRFNLPERIVLADADNELQLDLTNPFAQKILVERLRKGNTKLFESLRGMGSPVKDKKGRCYANEVILPFSTGSEISHPSSKPESISSGRLIRSFPPGSEWVYVKLYCGERDADMILSEQISRMVHEFEERKMINKWFFIRYHDPEPHIRLRFQIRNDSTGITYGRILDNINSVLAPLVASGIAHRIAYDTYDREVGRYGEDTIEICEDIFWYDSDYLLKIIPHFLKPGGIHARWVYAATGVDDMLTAFGATIQERLILVDRWWEGFAGEFRIGREAKKKMDSRYREFKPMLETNLNVDIVSGAKANAERGLRFAGLKDAFKLFGNVPRERSMEVLASLCHMYLNRIFFSNQRENEMMVYHFLGKYYHSRISRFKINAVTSSGEQIILNQTA